MSRKLTIILRTCGKIHALNGSRYVNKTKPEIINTCVSSLINSINQVTAHEIELFILDDHSDSSVVDDIKTISQHCKFPVNFIPVEDGTGASHTCYRVYDIVEKHCSDLWLHIEDDYLHYPESIQDMIDTVDQLEDDTGQMIAINPHDDIWRYTRQIYDSIILLGPYRHYRTVRHTTYTCMASRLIYDTYRDHFQDSAKWILKRDENDTINQVWNKSDVMLFSPIPSLALHLMEESGKDPYINFDVLWDSIPKLWKNQNKLKFAVASMFNDSHAELAKETWYNNKKLYCDKHGYLALAKTDNFSTSQIHFDKFQHLLDIMSAHPDVDWIWYIDNDAMITNYDVKLENLVNTDAHVIMGVDIASLNSGSFMVRNSMQTQNWLQFLLSKKSEYAKDTKWFDQQAVIDFYVKFQDIFHVVKQATFNSYDYKMYNVSGVDLLGHDGQWNPGDFVIHWPGLNNSVRIKLAKHYQQYIK